MPPVTVWRLVMDSAAELRPAPEPDAEWRLDLQAPPDPGLNRRLYAQIGSAHAWVDHRDRPLAWWAERVAVIDTLVLRVSDEVAGYAELEPREDGSVDIAYLGVLPDWQGRGLGGWLLTGAVRHAWWSGARRVSVGTCELDGAAALPNYWARGFRVVEETVEERPVR